MSNNNNKQVVIDAISRLRHKVSVSDVAAATGLPLLLTNQLLNKVALECHAVLSVAATGDVLYTFKPDFESTYAVTSVREACKQALSYTVYFLSYMVRVSFGILLIGSFLTLIVVFAIALCIIMMGMGDADGDGDLDLLDGDLDFDFFDLANLAVFFTVAAGDLEREETTYLGQTVDMRSKGFLLNCFSFLFGDGNPNFNVEDKKWQYLAELIWRSGGVVITEQLAPYTGSASSDENAALPVLVRFDGCPQVTDKGSIVYVFPAMRTTASTRRLAMDLPDWLQEKEWQFSTIPTERLHTVFFFGAANLAGWFCLQHNLKLITFLQPWSQFVHWMVIYAFFFMGLPMLRQLGNNIKNAVIDVRNKHRARNFQLLASPKVQAKLMDARQYVQGQLVLEAQPIVYTTAQDLLEQQFS